MQTLVGDIIELNALDSEKVRPRPRGSVLNLLSLVQACVEQLSPSFHRPTPLRLCDR